jgi:pimeloyl-ACP methyl ester carboxylesterase
MRPALNALARDARVISYSLCGDIGSGMKMDAALGFDSYIAQIDRVLDRVGAARAAICGVSYGGVIAVHYAALRPERVSHLILASSPGPGWEPSERQARYAARPWRSLVAFCATAVGRLDPEVRAALTDWPSRIGFVLAYVGRIFRAPMLPHRMGERVQLQRTVDGAADCARIQAPTLVITGEPSLDRVVPVESTREYVGLIHGAQYVMLDRTGHIGSLTQPDRFAAIVREFLASHP